MDLLNAVSEIVPLWGLYSIVAGIAAYWYLTKGHSYWKKQGIPYVPPYPLLGNFADILRNPFHEVEMKRYKEKGRIYGTYEGQRPILTLAEPDLLRDILVKDFQHFTGRRSIKSGNPALDKNVSNLQGEDWKRVRTIISPAFTTGRIRKMTSIFNDCAKALTENFKKAAEEDKPLDMKRYFGAFTMDVIASSAFGTKIDSHNDPENPFVTTARNFFSRNASMGLILFLLFPGLMKLTGIKLFKQDLLTFFPNAALKIIEERKKTGQRRNDFLQLLIDSVKEELGDEEDDAKDKSSVIDDEHEKINDQVFKSVYKSKSLSNDEMVAQCLIFFLAGYDTTASTLSFAVYELALNPEIQETLFAEIDETIREKGGLHYESIAEMKYLDRVVAETLRKYPPATRTERVAESEYHIKSPADITISKGMIIGIPVYAMHHDPQHYPDPEKFDPDRFTSEEKASRHPYTYLPFGAGPRNCIAMRFALVEVKVCLANLLSQCRISTCSQTKVPLEYHFGQGLMQPKEIILKVEARNVLK